MEAIVIPTESATSPPAIYVITLLAVPPGQQPTRITPSASSVGSFKIIQRVQAISGMIVYCDTNPISTSFGLENTTLKSSIRIVSPIPNIATPRNTEVYLVVQKASTENAMMITPMYLVKKELIFPILCMIFFIGYTP